MKQTIGYLLSAVIIALFAQAAPALAAVHTPAGATLNPHTCDVSGAPIVNVNYKIVNDYDSGIGGSAWANDSINRSLKVYPQGGGVYCGVVKDAGQFVSFAGASPLDTSVTIGAGIKGTLDGGYIAAFTATGMNPSAPAARGNLGTKNYACTDAYTCPGAFDWSSAYFSGVSGFDLPYWAWNYHAGNNGSMVQASTGYQGNITGN